MTKPTGVGSGRYERTPEHKAKLAELLNRWRAQASPEELRKRVAHANQTRWTNTSRQERAEAMTKMVKERWRKWRAERGIPDDVRVGNPQRAGEKRMAHPTALAYEIVQHDPPIDQRSAAKLTCYECGTLGKIVIAGMGNNPEKIQKLFVRLGWDADVFHRSRNWCPKCVAQRRVRVQKDLNDPPRPAPRVFPALKPPPQHFEEVTLGAGTRKGNTVQTIKDLSSQQKSDLRKELDGHFNEDTGQYEDDYSDHVLSEGLGIPRKIVEEFREALYGPLRDDPEISAFRLMVADAKKVIGNLQASVQRMETKIEEIAKKRGM